MHLLHELNEKIALQNIHSCCRMIELAPGGCWRFLICGCASLLNPTITRCESGTSSFRRGSFFIPSSMIGGFDIFHLVSKVPKGREGKIYVYERPERGFYYCGGRGFKLTTFGTSSSDGGTPIGWRLTLIELPLFGRHISASSNNKYGNSKRSLL